MFVNVSLVDFSQYIPWWNRGRRQLRTVNPTFTQTLVSAPGAPASPLATSQEAATPLALRVAARAHRTPPSGLRRAAAESWLTASRQPPPPALGPQIPLRVGPATLRLAAQAQRILRLQPQLRRSKPPWVPRGATNAMRNGERTAGRQTIGWLSWLRRASLAAASAPEPPVVVSPSSYVVCRALTSIPSFTDAAAEDYDPRFPRRDRPARLRQSAGFLSQQTHSQAGGVPPTAGTTPHTLQKIFVLKRMT